MDFFDVVKLRGSYRGPFAQEAVPQEALRKILEAGVRAPSGYNLQTTSFYVVTDAALRQKLAAIFPTKAVQTAPGITRCNSSLRTTPPPWKTSCSRSPPRAMPGSGWTA